MHRTTVALKSYELDSKDEQVAATITK